jgi:hypothetical protein
MRHKPRLHAAAYGSFFLMAACAWPAAAQGSDGGTIYRCGNEYTNAPLPQDLPQCQAVLAGSVVSIPAPTPKSNGRLALQGGAKPGKATVLARPASPAQLARDEEARQVLQAELHKASAHLADLQVEYQNGAPDKRGDEHRNHQKYLDRVKALQQSMVRTQADMQSIQNELGRLPAKPAAAALSAPLN